MLRTLVLADQAEADKRRTVSDQRSDMRECEPTIDFHCRVDHGGMIKIKCFGRLTRDMAIVKRLEYFFGAIKEIPIASEERPRRGFVANPSRGSC